MPHLFSPSGDFALRDICQHKPLLALDFDGTLAPIVPRPEDARAPLAISRILTQLAARLPVAIITGRAVADVSTRLGFSPHYIVGNHGAEGLPDASGPDRSLVSIWHQGLDHAALQAAGISVEDKGHSLSLHYRLARDQIQARNVIAAAIAGLSPEPRVIGGKCVYNLLPQDAPDKFQAVRQLIQLAGCESAIFMGDDVTDDVVFEQAPPHWLTIRVGAQDRHQARFHLSLQSEVASFLQRLQNTLETIPDQEIKPR